MPEDRKALSRYMDDQIAREHAELDIPGMFDRGKQWKLANTLQTGGTLLFPHAGLRDCGHHLAAVVQACLDSGASRVLALGVLHALTDELQSARVRVANGGEPSLESCWGVQGPGLPGRDDWTNEFSLSNFLFLFATEVKRRGMKNPPQVISRYPYLAGGKPNQLPGIEELVELKRQGAAVIMTTDAFHHGVGYGDPPERALQPEHGGLDLARETIAKGAAILERGDYWGYNQHCVAAKSDGRDVGQVARYLLGSLKGKILDATYTDTTEMYGAPSPTWVACALVEYSIA